MNDRLQALLAELAAADVDALIAETRAAGRAEAAEILRGMWRDAYVQAAGTPRVPDRTGTAWWVYGVVPAEVAVPAIAGVAGGAVRTITAGALAAIASEVPLADFGDEQLRRHLEDLAWVEQVARAHEHVLEEAMETGPVVPLRLCTICLDEERVAGLVDASADVFATALRTLRGRSEWGVKVFATPLTAATGPTTQDDPQAYLDRKRRARDHREQAQATAMRTAEEIHETVSALAEAAVVNAPQHREAHGRDADMVLNGAYLVADERRDELAELATRLAEDHAPFQVELTGPWPPYNFVAPQL